MELAVGYNTFAGYTDILERFPGSNLEGTIDIESPDRVFVVGGLVEQLLDIYCAEHGISLPFPEKPRKPAANPPLAQYRYRQRGQQLVADIGFRDAMALYMDSPTRFRERL